MRLHKYKSQAGENLGLYAQPISRLKKNTSTSIQRATNLTFNTRGLPIFEISQIIVRGFQYNGRIFHQDVKVENYFMSTRETCGTKGSCLLGPVLESSIIRRLLKTIQVCLIVFFGIRLLSIGTKNIILNIYIYSLIDSSFCSSNRVVVSGSLGNEIHSKRVITSWAKITT